MNQILATDIGNKKKTSKPIDIKKIVVFFACAIFLFGATVAGVTGYRMYMKQTDKTREIKPELTVERVGDKIRIKGKYEEGIEKLTYYWSENNKIESMENGRRSLEKMIDIPPGTNTLVILLETKDRKIEQWTSEYTGRADATIIDIQVAKDDGIKLKITVENPIGLKYITYQWNDDVEERLDADPNDPTILALEIPVDRLDIGRGRNEMTIRAIDSLDREETKVKTVEGQYEPVVSWMQHDKVVECTVTHDMGFKSIEFMVNWETVYTYDANVSAYSPTKVSVTYAVPLKDGENIIGIKAESREGTKLERVGRAMYPPEN